MNIIDATIYTTEIRVRLNVIFKEQEISLFIRVVNGNVYGSASDNVSTSFLWYFNEPLDERQKHFEQLKKYIQDNIIT